MKPWQSRQRGAALVIALVMLSVILLLGTATVSILMLDEHAARNHQAHLYAMIAAQAALDEACDEISRGVRVAEAAFPATPGCHTDAQGRGLCRTGAANGIAWNTRQLTDTGAGAATYGEFSGRNMRLHDVAPARYLIELLEQTPAAGQSGNGNAGTLYRINAAGFGTGQAQAGLQAVVRRQSTPGNQAECLRLAWRTLPLTK